MDCRDGGLHVAHGLACEQASWGWQGGKKKESLQLHLWNMNICKEKVDVICWLAEMTFRMMSLLLARVFQCLFILCSFVLCTDWWTYDSWADEEPQGNWRWNSNSRDVVASFPSFTHPAARTPWRAATWGQVIHSALRRENRWESMSLLCWVFSFHLISNWKA